MRLYEGFFLIDSAQANRSLDSITEELTSLLQKHGSTVVRSGVWGERKLAYEVKGSKRGTYILYYFKMNPLKMVEFKQDLALSERVLRAMITREDRSEEEIMAKETLQDQSVPIPAEGSEDDHSHSHRGRERRPYKKYDDREAPAEVKTEKEEADKAEEEASK